MDALAFNSHMGTTSEMHPTFGSSIVCRRGVGGIQVY
uniref:Uncharacterized protein n=1 Tax=Lupinus angustifolius TaxID=3871 RepID=L0P188_LUPAN|nr:hypothetical protein [Lupinus angustifolius]